MLDGLGRFGGRTLLIISGNDLTAQEFCDLIRDSSALAAAAGLSPGVPTELA